MNPYRDFKRVPGAQHSARLLLAVERAAEGWQSQERPGRFAATPQDRFR